MAAFAFHPFLSSPSPAFGRFSGPVACAPFAAPRSAFPSADLSSLFQFFDEVDQASPSPCSSSNKQRHEGRQHHRHHRRHQQAFQPRFDVHEDDAGFHLQGDLPGIAREDVSIEFADPRTLVVSGRTVRESQRGDPALSPQSQQQQEPQAAVEQAAAEATPETQAETVQPDSASTASHPNYQRASVADESDEFVDVGHEEAAVAAAAKPADAPAEAADTSETEQQQPQQVAQQVPEQPAEQPTQRYWIHERSVGSFRRTFTFAGDAIDHGRVRAQLRDGVLTVDVPKRAPEPKRTITVE